MFSAFFVLLGGYPLRVHLWRLSLRSNFPKLSLFQLIFPFFRFIEIGDRFIEIAR